MTPTPTTHIKILAAAAVIILLSGCYAGQTRELSAEQLASAQPDQLEASFEDHAGIYGVQENSYAARVRAQDLVSNHPDWDKQIKAAIAAGEVHEGMTQRQVWWSWGPPARTAHEDSPYGKVDRWAWGDTTLYREVTFRSGRVLWWTNAR